MEEKKNPVEIAKKLCELLNAKGVEAECDFSLEPISECLRDSWYVNKVMELGYVECIYIDVSSGGFFAILEDGRIMSGGNFMINNAFSELFSALDLSFDFLWSLEDYYDNGGEDHLVIGTLEQLKKILANANDVIDEEKVKRAFTKTFQWMDLNDIERLWNELKDEILSDIEDCADINFNDDDVRIAIRRVIFDRLEIDS